MDPNDFHAKVLNNKFLPISIKQLILIGASWTFRGTVFYMDRTEKAFAIILEILSFLIFSILSLGFLDLYKGLFAAFIIAHTINWLFNGQVFLVFKNLGLTRVDRKRFIEYALALQRRVSNKDYFSAVAIFGSISRGELKESSDLDVHAIRRSGIVNSVKACVLILLERIRAFLQRFPLDIYVDDSSKKLLKLRQDEPPVILYDPDGELQKREPHFFLDEVIPRIMRVES